MPRRPPRHPPSPSTRSRSLELLDQDEKKSVSPIREPEPQPRPRSRSLDGLLDEDGIVPDMETEESPESGNESKTNATEFLEALQKLSEEKMENDLKTEQERAESRIEEEAIGEIRFEIPNQQIGSQSKSKGGQSPTPIPRQRMKPSVVEVKAEPGVQREETRKSSSFETYSDKEGLPTRPSKPSRFMSVDEHLSTVNSNAEGERENPRTNLENIDRSLR